MRMAATRLITMHQNKGKSVAKSLSDRTDCAKNGEKTENGQFISSYACQAESVDEKDKFGRKKGNTSGGIICRVYQGCHWKETVDF